MTILTKDKIKKGLVLTHKTIGTCVVKDYISGVVTAIVDGKDVPLDVLVVRQFSTGKDSEHVLNVEGCLERFTIVEVEP
jgi:hypothetical protein